MARRARLLRFGLGEEFFGFPAAAEGFDELDGGDEALAGELGFGALGVQGVAAGIDDFEVADDAGGVAVGGEVGGAAGMGDGAALASA